MSNYWIPLGVFAVILLVSYWKTKNAVWGGLTIGLFIGVVISILLYFTKGYFAWGTLIEAAIIGILLGYGAELLGKLSDYLKVWNSRA